MCLQQEFVPTNANTVNSTEISSNDNDDHSENRAPWFGIGGLLLPERHDFVRELFQKAIQRGMVELDKFPHDATLEKRLLWATTHGWIIGGLYLRCSSDMQDSYAGQIVECVDLALKKRIMVFPELMAGDEGISGRKSRRPGFSLFRSWIVEKKIGAVVTFSISRWFRSFLKGLLFICEDVEENGIRALSKAENFDTADPKWKLNAQLQLLVAEMQVSGQSSFVRMGHRRMFEDGFLVGACPLGYIPEPVPAAGKTKKGKPLSKPVVHRRVADLIQKHFELFAGGMGLARGCRLWNEEIATWPEEDRKRAMDPRSAAGYMTDSAYRRLLGREEYCGRWIYGEYKSKWLGRKDYSAKEKAASDEVITHTRNHLRIVSDEVFERVQIRLQGQSRGKHGPRARKAPPLCDAILPLFRCGRCGRPFGQYGKRYGRCLASEPACDEYGTIDRRQSLALLLEALQTRILSDPELVEDIVREARLVRLEGGNADARPKELKQALAKMDQKMRLMEDGIDLDADNAELRQRYRETANQRCQLALELKQLETRRKGDPKSITPEAVRDILARFSEMLRVAGTGELGEVDQAEAANLIRSLTGGRIDVFFERRDRKRRYGRARFHPALPAALRNLGDLETGLEARGEEVTLELRPLPAYERIADEVRRLCLDEGMKLCAIARKLGVGYNLVWRAFRYWHTSRNLPVPAIPMGAPKKTVAT